MSTFTLSFKPWKFPDWRWQRACSIVERGGYATIKRDGELIQRTVHYIRALNCALTERGVRSAAKKHPDIFLAFKTANEPTHRPLEIKARTLAGQSNRAIAREVGLTVPAVAAYIALFFDVRERLEAKTWISRVAIGLPIDRVPSVETVMLLHAWRRGPSVIDPWIDFLDHQEERHDLNTAIGRQRASLELLMSVQQLENTAAIRRSLYKKCHLTLLKSPEIGKSVTVAGAFCRNSNRLTEEIAWKRVTDKEFCASGVATLALPTTRSQRLSELSQAG